MNICRFIHRYPSQHTIVTATGLTPTPELRFANDMKVRLQPRMTEDGDARIRHITPEGLRVAHIAPKPSCGRLAAIAGTMRIAISGNALSKIRNKKNPKAVASFRVRSEPLNA